MNKSEEYYRALMTHRLVSRRGLFRALISAARHATPETAPPRLAHPLPPGAIPDEQFITQCTRCNKCIDACPMGILIRHEDGYPQLAIEYASCDGCARCISACPTDTLRAQSHFDTGLRPAFSDACVNLIRQCNQCVEACPEQACTLDEKGIPQVENDRCNGCGECQVQCYADAISLIRIPHLAKS